ncbi:hypothetical protein HZA57_05925, partial [Candidatus Poribacteria bacterium]|nr:hypothetical protein [Candidatus Poribacteria bacterium]
PEDREANLEMGRVLLEEKKYDDAEVFFTKVVSRLEQLREDERTSEMRQLMADAYIARGSVRMMTDGPDTAKKDYTNALAVKPEYPAAYYSMGEAYRKRYPSSKKLVDLKSAEENMRKARELDPKQPQFAIGLGILYQQDLSAADDANKDQYIKLALENYRDYLKNGGSDMETVRGWIRELGG